MAGLTQGRSRGGVTPFTTEVSVDKAPVDNLIQSVIRSTGTASMRVFGEKVADYIEDRVIDRFAVEGDDASGSWEPLAPSTQRIRAKLGFGADGPINVRTNQLIQHAVYSKDIDPIEGGVLVTAPDLSSMDAVTRKKYETAQFGTNSNPLFPGARTPARPVIGMSERDHVAIFKMLQVHIMSSTVANFVNAA